MNLEHLNAWDEYYDIDGTPLQFCSKRKTVYYDGLKIILDRLPYLLNATSGQIYFSIRAAMILNDYVFDAKEKGMPEITVNQFGRFNRGKLSMAGTTKFRYSAAEYFFTPGLERTPPDGYLAPVYFNKSVLSRFKHNPNHRLEDSTDSFGCVHWPDGNVIPYGINKDGFVIMWLGDIVSLPMRDCYYLYSENVEPQFDIHSDFYRNQILNEWL